MLFSSLLTKKINSRPHCRVFTNFFICDHRQLHVKSNVNIFSRKEGSLETFMCILNVKYNRTEFITKFINYLFKCRSKFH